METDTHTQYRALPKLNTLSSSDKSCLSVKEQLERGNKFVCLVVLPVPCHCFPALPTLSPSLPLSTAFSLFASTASVFGLYVVHSEVFVVVMLCVFTALSVPAWNDSSLLIAELYPTHLRYHMDYEYAVIQFCHVLALGGG